MINYSIQITKVKVGPVISSTLGALFHNNKIYLFRDGGECLVCDKQFNKLYTFKLPAYQDNTSYNPHCSSVEWIVPGEKVAVTTNASGLVNYADRIYIYNISDLSNIKLDVVMLLCTDKAYYARMAAMGYDQVNKIMYVAGYSSKSGSTEDSKCWFEAFDFSPYINEGTLSAPLIMQKESDRVGLHIQDAGFYNGYYYLACDHSNTRNTAYDGLFLWVLDNQFKTVSVINADKNSNKEGEAFYIAPEEFGTKFVLSNCADSQTYYLIYIHKTGKTEDPIKHSIVFLDYNGRVLSDLALAQDASITKPSEPSRSGYAFSGWSPTPQTTAKTSAVYTALYTENVTYYTVKFQDWNGTIISTQQVASGSAPTTPSNPTRTGYTFTGWSPAVSTSITSNVTYNATYEKDAEEYTIVFEDYDGSVISTQTVTEGTVITIPNSPSRDNYTFIGWSPSVSNTATANVTYVAQYQEFAEIPADAATLTLNKSLNVVGYSIDGQEHREDEIKLTSGTYEVKPLYRAFIDEGEDLEAVFNSWSDGYENEVRTITVDTEDVELTAYGTQEVLYLYGMPAPIAKSSLGTSITVGGNAGGTCVFTVSTNTTYKNEYIVTTTKRYNDEDRDIFVQDASAMTNDVKAYFAEHNITEECRFFGAIPSGYTKVNVRIITGEGEDNTPTSRNPNIILITGDSYDKGLYKVYGATDIKRPINSSIIGEGVTFDYAALEVANKTGAQDFTENMKRYNLFAARLIGNEARLNNSIIRIQFYK